MKILNAKKTLKYHINQVLLPDIHHKPGGYTISKVPQVFRSRINPVMNS
jgi:hypothetical protein